ncbi:hypothetical protein [Oceanicola sp. 502str15]|uniref:hypothetical protein n=1 Tax=Oceanicola sp. 502str15 TaxID=2696061 RepID=UPI0020958FFD|nr:hypothetical protein [Oceanicola sp. 502str15]MCO6381706.1 hypothetical protein [Oceanicola sp. 502str15]
MSDTTPAFLSHEQPAAPGPLSRLSARLIRLSHSRGRIIFALLAALLTGLVMSGPLQAVLGLLWFVTEGFSVHPELIRPTIMWFSFTVVVGLIYAALWATTMLLCLPLRGMTEWAATLVFLQATLKQYAPAMIEAVPNWAFVLLMGTWVVNFLLIKTGLSFAPLPWLTRHHRTRFTLPMPPLEAYERLRAHPGRPFWDAGYTEITEVTPGDDSHLKVEVRRRRGIAYTLWLRFSAEVPGKSLTIHATDRPDRLEGPRRPAQTLTLTAQGHGSTLVEVRTHEPHTLATLSADPMEDRETDYWAHAAAEISGRPNGTFSAALLRPAGRA